MGIIGLLEEVKVGVSVQLSRDGIKERKNLHRLAGDLASLESNIRNLKKLLA